MFATYDRNLDNPNVYKQSAFEDIEGLWTYTYFSYSHNLNKAVGFIGFAGSDAVKVEFAVKHNIPEYLRLILGGHELEIYPGLNG
jgi:hypothetical protein